jgi:hypothetical protein
MRAALTRDEFEEMYASNSGISVEELHGVGLFARPCDCDEPECEGWEMDWEHRHERLNIQKLCPIEARIWFPDDTERFVWIDCTLPAGHTPWLHSWQTPGNSPFVMAPPADDVRNVDGGPKGYPYE